MANLLEFNSQAPYVTRAVTIPNTGAAGGGDEMHYAVLQPKGSLTSVAANIAALRFPFTGTLKEVRVYCAASNISAVEAIFDINAGPSPGAMVTVFSNPANRPRITPGQLQGSVTGLDIAVTQDWFCSVDIDSVPTGGVTGPVFVVLVLEKS